MLELDHTPVEHRDRTRCLLSQQPEIAEEFDEPAHPPHVLVGDVLLTTHARAPAAVSRKATNDALIDVGDRDLGLRQPLREVAGRTIKASHSQIRMPRLPQMARELRNQRGNIARIHAQPPAAVIFTRLDHALLPSRCHQDSERGPELCGVRKRAHCPTLLITSTISNRAMADSA